MDQCCRNQETKGAGGLTVKDLKVDAGCCAACPDKGCEGCACATPVNTTGGCMQGGCGCGNR